MPQPENCNAISPQVRRLIKAMVSECQNPVRLLELHYWSTEPELLPIIRGFALLPSQTRATLEAFIRGTDPNGVSAEIDAGGQIRLTPKHTGKFAVAPS